MDTKLGVDGLCVLCVPLCFLCEKKMSLWFLGEVVLRNHFTNTSLCGKANCRSIVMNTIASPFLHWLSTLLASISR